MEHNLGEQREEIIHKLEILNAQVRQQMSIWFVFRNGLIYGVGFIIGSTILTAIIVTFILQFFRHTIMGDVILWIAGTR